jgi:hypothetical protein
MAKVNKLEHKTFSFGIRSVELLKHSFAVPNNPIDNFTNFNFNIGVEQKLDHTNKLFIVILNIDVTSVEDIGTKLGSASIACIYDVENFDRIVNIDKSGKPNIDETITQTLNSISISTSRGVLSQLFKGTFLHNAILPIIDPKTFKPE